MLVGSPFCASKLVASLGGDARRGCAPKSGLALSEPTVGTMESPQAALLIASVMAVFSADESAWRPAGELVYP